ncbi:MAG TPA: adenylate/guanylate cyclase domain-containing protein, partial [Nannocystis exedens]|nr:adenylate/guanylate cyclase domain-containing protein [Nannocystis exedens]
TDLRGFSGISERLTAENVVKLLNIYLGSMAQVIDRYGGSINEFIGDAILVVFGAPIFHEDAAQRAVACSLAMQMEMERVNIDCIAAGLPRLEMGIGVHTGEVIIGNIGSKRRTKYGLVGRNVNLASRVETYTVGGQVLISEATAAELGDRIETRGCFQVKPKGFASAIMIYDVFAIDGPFAVRLPVQDDELEALPQAVSLRVSVVDGKDAGGIEDIGWIEALSETRALLRTPLSLDPLVNVKLNFDPQISADDVYAKVLSRQADAPQLVQIRFTPTPAGLARALRREAETKAQ